MAFADIFSKKVLKEGSRGKIVVDNRERNSLVVSELIGLGFEIEWKQLPVADYLVGDVAIERKTISDLKSSVVNKRIVQQLIELKQYDKFFLLVEGIIEDDIYSGGIHENAFRGFLLSVALDYGVPLIFTYDEKDTAKYLDVLARRGGKGSAGIRASKIFLSPEEQKQFILEGFPNVGAKKAQALLDKFGSLSGVFNASVEELAEVLGKRADYFKDLIDS